MARTTKPLTNTQIDKAKPKEKVYRLYDGNGLVMNITPNGGKYWYLQYKHPNTGKAQMHKLGNYPALGLADAREKSAFYHSLLAKNIDPKQHDLQQNAQNDLLTVYQSWAKTKDYTEKHHAKNNNYVRDTIAIIGNKSIADISVPDLVRVLKPVESIGQYEKLKKWRSLLNQIFAYAVASGHIEHNPALNLRGAFGTGEVRHNPAILDEKRLAELVRAIDEYHGSIVTRQALRYALLTFARPGEVRHLKWQDIHDDFWHYQPSKTRKKTGVEMITPLSSQALQIIHARQAIKCSDFVFPSVTGNTRPLSENTLNQALRRMGFDSSEQTTHGFRAIARTLLEEKFKYDYRMIEMQLGHLVRDSNGRAYNRVTWLDERKEMMQKWADYLDSIK